MTSKLSQLSSSGVFLNDLTWHFSSESFLLTDEDLSDDLACLRGNNSFVNIDRPLAYLLIVLVLTPSIACLSIIAELILWLMLVRLLKATRLLFYLLLAVKAGSDLLMLSLWLISDLLDSCPYVCPFSSGSQLFHYKSVFYAKVYFPLANACSAASTYMMLGITLLWCIVVHRSNMYSRCCIKYCYQYCIAISAAWLLALGINLPRSFCLVYRCYGDQLTAVSAQDWCRNVYRWLTLALMQIGPLLALVSLSSYLTQRMFAIARRSDADYRYYGNGCQGNRRRRRNSSRRARCILLMNACFLVGQLPAFLIHPDTSQTAELLERELPASTRVIVASLINCLEALSYTANLLVLINCDSRFKELALSACLGRRLRRRRPEGRELRASSQASSREVVAMQGLEAAKLA